jgi:esterase FrsA
MTAWSEGVSRDPSGYFEPFFFRFGAVLEQLSSVIQPGCLAAAGLSRGGFIATHLAARYPQIKTVLGFAPATKLMELNGFPPEAERWDLEHQIPRLLKVRLKFYIGNRDIRVGTSTAFQFCHHLTEQKFKNGERTPQVEFSMFPSIGHKGHGTPMGVFLDGAEWVRNILMNKDFT